jgi:hypothetical protein
VVQAGRPVALDFREPSPDESLQLHQDMLRRAAMDDDTERLRELMPLLAEAQPREDGETTVAGVDAGDRQGVTALMVAAASGCARREKAIGGPGGSLEPPGPLLPHRHNVYMAYSERLPTRLNPLAERICFSQVCRCCGAAAEPGCGRRRRRRDA